MTMTATTTSTLLLDADFLAARNGDPHAFARLVTATQRMVASVALAVTRDVQLSEDVAQETYLSIWQRLADVRDADSFLPWLRQATRNRAIDQLRRRRQQEVALADDDIRMAAAVHPGPGPDASLHASEQGALLASALDAIPDESREVLLLFYREGQSSRQVANLLGLSDAAVRKRLQRARDALQADVLARLGQVAAGSAPGVVFTALVVGSLASPPAQAAVAAGAAPAAKWALGALGALASALALMLAAVAWDLRVALRGARNPVERRELLHHGLIAGAVMMSFVAVLAWSRHAQWASATTLAVAACYSVGIIVLGVRRHRIHRRHRPSR